MKLKHFQSKGWFWLKALTAFSFVAAPLHSHAANSWSSKPVWAQDSYSSVQNQNVKKVLKKSQPTSPFAPGSHNLSIDIGQVFLMGDLSSSYSDSIGLQAHYTYGVSDLFGMDMSIGRSSHSDGVFSMTSFKAGLRTNLSWYDRVIPYAIIGLGFYSPSHDAVGASGAPASSLLFGVHLGPGVNLTISDNIYFGASLTFHDIFGDQKILADGSRYELGGTFTTFLLSAGYSF